MDYNIGTSGYSYKHWADGVFYPPGLSPRKWLEFYCEKFNTVELNVTFYRLPRDVVFHGWDRRTPADFRFVVKGSRYITHIKRLKEPAGPLDLFEKAVRSLGSKVRCILWQLPPAFGKDSDRLTAFCEEIGSRDFLQTVGHVFEFRNESWFCREIYDILMRFNACLCFADAPRKIGTEVRTADFLYVRFHGSSTRDSSDYTEEELRVWVDKVIARQGEVKTVYAYFNNDAHGYAPANARQFRTMLLSRVS